jgi:predicted RNA-binding protein with TRAM domain
MQNRCRLLPNCLWTAALLFFPFAVFAQTSTVEPRITTAINDSQLTTLRGNTHPFARPEFDRGAAPDSLPMQRMLLVLKRSAAEEAALETLLDQQQDQSSPNYHAWIAPQQFGLQFGPATQDIQTITQWLESYGFLVNRVSNGRTVIEFSGTAGQVRDAFHTEIHRYNIDNEDHWANSSDPQIPTALTPVVAGIDTLYNFPRHAMHHVDGVVSRSKATGKLQSATPLFTLGGTCGVPGVGCYGLSPYDFATIYNVLPLWSASPTTDGTGETIAIVAQTDIALSDVSSFRSYFGLPANSPTIILDGPDPGTVQGDETESDLDIEWSGAVAKGATIDVVTSESTEASLGVDLSAEYVVDNNLAPILSESYGICELFLGSAGNQFYNQLWQQASAEGITALVATGDGGSAVCDRNDENTGPAELGLSVSGFSSTPYNVAVGGTDFFDLTDPSTYWSATNTVPPGAPAGTPATVSAISYIPETTWNDSCTNAVFGNLLGFSTNAETNCNSAQLIADGFVTVLGGSGGESNCTTYDGPSPTACTGGYAKPSWQTGTDGKRDVPDVSLFAASGSPSGAFYLICEADAVQAGSTSCDSADPNTEFLAVGGTSASTPSFAGIMALVDQKTGSRQGNANYVLYKLAAQTAASCNSSNGAGTNCVFYDVTNGTIAMPCATGSPNCDTSNAGDAVGVLSGYAAASGYDLATGLGSVNASNLVRAWVTANTALTTSTTTLALNSGTPVNIMHGQSVPVSIGVTGTGGTPTGNVSLIANTAPSSAPSQVTEQGVQGFSLVNGLASGNTSALPGGTYTVFAQYPGDGTFGGSSSTPPVSVTVAEEPSKTFADLVTLNIDENLTDFGASSATYGSGYYLLRIDVGNAAATVSSSAGISSSCSKGVSNCPTGTITLTSTGSPLGMGSLSLNSQGYAEIQSLAVGSYAVSASYGGDASYGSSSATANFTVSKASTMVSAASEGSPVQYGNLEQVSADVATTSDGIAPTGTFTFFVDGTAIGAPVPVYESGPYNPTLPPSNPAYYAWADAISSTEFLSVGKHTLAAQYSGDGNYAGATSGAATVNVTQAQPFFSSWGASPATVNVNQQVRLTAQMTGSDAGVAPTGTMTFSANNKTVSGTVTYTPSAHGLSASVPYTPTVAGTYNITVSYSGDTNYLPASTPGAATLTVTGSTFTIAANPTTIPVSAPGGSGSTVLTFTAQGGFSSGGSVTITPTCADLPPETSCSSGASITLPTNGTAMATVTFQTTAASAASPASRNRPDVAGWRLTASALALACLLCWTMLRLGHQGSRGWRIALVFTVLALLAVSAGCGGGSGGASGGGGNPGTLPGNYRGVSVTVTINGVMQTISGLTLNVE